MRNGTVTELSQTIILERNQAWAQHMRTAWLEAYVGHVFRIRVLLFHCQEKTIPIVEEGNTYLLKIHISAISE